MKVQELLNELLDTRVTTAKVRTRHPGQFKRKARIGNRDIYFEAEGVDGSYNIEFYEEDPENPRKVWDRNFDITGSGNEFQVFAMIKSCIEELIDERQPDEITFSADKSDKNRANLYERLFKKFMTKGYVLDRQDHLSKTSVIFTLSKEEDK